MFASTSRLRQPDTGTSTHTRSFYLPQLDALRFFAFLCVFVYHTLFTDSQDLPSIGPHLLRTLVLVRETGGFGLSLFFFLSSFLITTLLIKERRITGSIDLKSFYIRRILRIWPLYFGVLAAFCIAGVWMPSAHLSLGRTAAFAFLSANWFSVAYGLGPMLTFHLWSISVEEQFYLLWPGLFLFCSRKAFFILTIVSCLLSLVVTYLLSATGSHIETLWLNSGTEALFFASGALLALLDVNIIPSPWRAVALICAGIGLWFSAAALGEITNPSASAVPWRATSAYALVAIGCYFLLTGFLSVSKDRVPGWLSYLGKISYGLYVYHVVGLHLGGALTMHTSHLWSLVPSLLITVGLAAFSYTYFEAPFLTLKRRFELVKTRAV